jgi:hypothetical protein
MSKHATVLLVRITLVAIGAILALFSTYAIYINLKKDNLDGRGTILVENCTHIGPSDGDYNCTGAYQQGAGGFSPIRPATVHVSSPSTTGDYLSDVYRDTSVSIDAPAEQQHYISGEERRGIIHNLAYITGIVIGLGLLCTSIFYRRGSKNT